MSDNVPTEQLLIKELKDVTNWELFGVSLGVHVRVLNRIKLDDPNGGVENWKLRLFQFWLQYKPGASWKDAIRALEDNDYCHLAATLSKKYLLIADSSDDDDDIDENVNNIEAEETAAVIERLQDLETSFTYMLTNLLDLLSECKCDLSKAQFFLDDQFDTDKFSRCTSFNTLLRQLRKEHVDTFNTYYLQQFVACFKEDQLTERVKEYEAEKEQFLLDTTVLEFQQAVASKVEPLLAGQTVKLTIKISKWLANNRNLKDIEKLALKAFDKRCWSLVRMHAEVGSVVISWFFPEDQCAEFITLAIENATIFRDAGVEEMTVHGRVVFPGTLEEDIPTLKKIYIDFYHRLVEAVSDEHACQSLLTQLGSGSALISKEKMAQLSSSKVTGSSFLYTLGLEEEPHLLVPFVSAMSRVEQLQTLAEEMTAELKKGIDHDDEKPLKLEAKEREQLETNIERLTSDKEDLLSRLKCCEEELKAANELLVMREKTISGMMAASGTGLEDTIRQKSVSDIAVQTTTDEGLVPLPAGWEARTAPNSCVDHNTRTTQWQDPRIIEQYQLPSLSDLPALPQYTESPAKITKDGTATPSLGTILSSVSGTTTPPSV